MWSAELARNRMRCTIEEWCCQMTRPKKGFDAVAMMRSIRDKISTDIEGMTLEQELAWLSSQELSDPFLKRL